MPTNLTNHKALDAYYEALATDQTQHVAHKQAKEFWSQWIENKDVPFSWPVTKIQLSGDKTQLKDNESLTLTGIPAECFEYRLGNRQEA